MDQKPPRDKTPPHDRTVDSDETVEGRLEPARLPEGARYRIVRPHSQGGLGAVWVALDLELNREVALKQIHSSHADSVSSRERFLLEAEITGSLEHPGIVPIYSLGANEQGQPYYAMRFIRGDNLMDAIARFHAGDAKHDPGARALGLQKLLRRFLDVCNAIDYAHGRGVLHRDIKPGNIIVGKHGETLVVDWGLAKVHGKRVDRATAGESPRSPSTEPDEQPISPSLSASTETIAGTALGTPAYMSPEQARGDLEALGPASDVYSLGATLYCLLVGKPPFEGSVSDVLSAVKAGHFTRPRQRDKSIDRALEGVCEKAMALSPADRYASVRALADDIERWLADEPVSAVREPVTTQLRRWSRRHRALASSAAVAVLTIIAALSISTVLVNRERRKAEANFQQARAVVDTYFTQVSQSKLLDVPGMQPLRRDLLDAAVQYYQGFLSEHGDDPSVRAETAAASFRVGWMMSQMGNSRAAAEPYRAAMKLYAQLAKADPANREYRSRLALCYGAMAFNAADTDSLARAEGYHRRALAIRRALAREDTTDYFARDDVARTYGNLGRLIRNLGRPDEAIAALDSAAALGEVLVALPLENVPRAEDFTRRGDIWSNVREDLARIHGARSDVLREAGKLDGAIVAWKRSRQLYQELVAKHPESLDYRNAAASSDNTGATLLLVQGHYQESLTLLEQALQSFEALVAANPGIPLYQSNVAEVQFAMVSTLYRMGRKQESLAMADRAIASLDQAIKIEPMTSRETKRAEILNDKAGILFSEGRAAESLAVHEDARVSAEKSLRAEPESIYHRSVLVRAVTGVGRAAAAAKQPERARAALREALELDAPLASKYPVEAYQTACIMALLVPLSAPAEREAAAAEAMKSLRNAIAAGYQNYGLMKVDSDLDAIRDRADFKALMAKAGV